MQFITTVMQECAGAPKKSGSGRRACATNPAVIPLPPSARGRNQRWTHIRGEMESFGWKNLKTLGTREWLCPRCTLVVLNTRAAMKDKWG